MFKPENICLNFHIGEPLEECTAESSLQTPCLWMNSWSSFMCLLSGGASRDAEMLSSLPSYVEGILVMEKEVDRKPAFFFF